MFLQESLDTIESRGTIIRGKSHEFVHFSNLNRVHCELSFLRRELKGYNFIKADFNESNHSCYVKKNII